MLPALLMLAAFGCARDPASPPTSAPEGAFGSGDPGSRLTSQAPDGRYRLWGEWSIFIDETHTKVDVVPRRQGRFHLNALKFLEDTCKNCLQVTKIKNNGDGTIDLTVRITHPFPGHPEFTGFDVKGIIMFNGSWENEGCHYFPPWPEPFRVSWRGLGDPQVLNADGYTLRWSPWYDSGKEQAIFNYWEGKYATGTPTANLNAYLDFYTDEDRHMFKHYGIVTRTYRIWVPPGEPVVAAYAVEACWEPPSVTPVIDPASDFPSTANQPEAYEFYFNLNNGEVITDPDCCGKNYDPSTAYMFSKQWGGHTAKHFAMYSEYYSNHGGIWQACNVKWPEITDPYDQYCGHLFNAEHFPDGDYIGVAINYRFSVNPPLFPELAYALFEFTIDLE
jgi:hypothetical protein